jgi:hypothetical protein
VEEDECIKVQSSFQEEEKCEEGSRRRSAKSGAEEWCTKQLCDQWHLAL